MQVHWIKRYKWLPWVIKLSSGSVVNLTLFSLIFHSIRGEIQWEEGQWKLGIRQADVTTTVLRTSHSWSREYTDFVIVHWICILTGPFVLNKIMAWYMNIPIIKLPGFFFPCWIVHRNKATGSKIKIDDSIVHLWLKIWSAGNEGRC